MSRRAFICGISGQDGAYLAKLLLGKGYRVVGSSRDVHRTTFDKLRRLGILDRVELVSMSPADFGGTLQALKNAAPDEIYNLAGQSSVALSFQQPAEALESNSLGVLNLLRAIASLGSKARLYNATSSECFGDTGERPADEDTPFHPRSPYAVAKAAAHWMVVNCREAYGLHACNGILFNHESPLRPAQFVTRKIVAGACAIKKGHGPRRLSLGSLDISRDWGYAPEYAEAMWRLMQLDRPTDLVIATGRTHSLQDFVAAAFSELDLDWRRHVDLDPGLRRPSDIGFSAGNPARARALIGWQAESDMARLVRIMVREEMAETAAYLA